MWETSEQQERNKNSERAISGGQQAEVPDCRERETREKEAGVNSTQRGRTVPGGNRWMAKELKPSRAEVLSVKTKAGLSPNPPSTSKHTLTEKCKVLAGEQMSPGRKVEYEVPCKAVTKSEVSMCEEAAEGVGT